MPAPTAAPPAPARTGNAPAAPARKVSRRRALPGSRAVVGGLLVSASAVGLFAAYGSTQDGPASLYVVLDRDVPAGRVLVEEDFVLVPIDLPPGQRAVSFTDPSILVRNLAAARLKKGQLVQSTDVVDVRDRRGTAEVSVPVEPGNAMNGMRLAGEHVDVIATFTTGGAPVTRTVAEDVSVVEVLGGKAELGSNGQLTVVLAVEPQELEPIAQAAAVAEITLARTTGLAR